MIIGYIYFYDGLQDTSNTPFIYRWRDTEYSQDITQLFMNVSVFLAPCGCRST